MACGLRSGLVLSAFEADLECRVLSSAPDGPVVVGVVLGTEFIFMEDAGFGF